MCHLANVASLGTVTITEGVLAYPSFYDYMSLDFHQDSIIITYYAWPGLLKLLNTYLFPNPYIFIHLVMHSFIYLYPIKRLSVVLQWNFQRIYRYVRLHL